MYKIRPALETDANLIINSWMRSYRKGDFSRCITQFTFNTEHRKLIISALKRSKVLCSVSIEDDDQIYGWICFEKTQLHYVYIKESFRDLGLARSLLKELPEKINFSHMPKNGLAKYLFSIGDYNPYPFLKGDTNENLLR